MGGTKVDTGPAESHPAYNKIMIFFTSLLNGRNCYELPENSRKRSPPCTKNDREPPLASAVGETFACGVGANGARIQDLRKMCVQKSGLGSNVGPQLFLIL
jgi:hypothetical protein